MKSMCIIGIMAVLLTIPCVVLPLLKPVPKVRGKVYGPSKMPAKPVQATRYEKLLAKYLANIDVMAAEYEKRTYRFRDKELEADRVMDIVITRNESGVLEELRALGRRNIDKEECSRNYPGDKIIAASDTSARLFATLIDEYLYDPGNVINALHTDCAFLSGTWIAVIQKIVNKAPMDSDLYRNAVYTLYSAGVSRKEYRPVLERWCQEKTDWAALMALHALFFDVDKQTGKPIAVKSKENLLFMQKLLKENDNPEIRFGCADFAAGIGNLPLAEEICLELLSRRYKGFDNVDVRPGPEEDGPLYRARHFALFLMFYKIRNERVFRAIYDLSRRPEDEEIKAAKGQMPKGWIIYSAYTSAAMEVDTAKSFIDQVNDYNNDHR